MKLYRPPLTITPEILSLCEKISREIGRLEGAKMVLPPIKLRRTNQVKTIQASLAIEGNTMTIDQVTDIVNNRRVIGPNKDILEVKNAIQVYNNLSNINPLKLDNLLNAHKLLMQGLVKECGVFRTKGVGIFKGSHVAHVAPQAKRVPKLMQDLFGFLNNAPDISWLLKSCIFHYEFEFIHPFIDGNGRMGRLWQQLILQKEHPIFTYTPVEELVKENQKKYYEALEKSDQAGDSTEFVAFSLTMILASLNRYASEKTLIPHDAPSRLEHAKSQLQNKWFSRKDYLNLHADISLATASRDLLYGVNHDILITKGEKNQAKYQFSGK